MLFWDSLLSGAWCFRDLLEVETFDVTFGVCYYENFTVIRNDPWFGSKCSHPYIKGELFKTKNRPQRTPAPKGWSIPQTKTGSIELKHWHNVEISIVNNCTQIDQNRPTPISKPTTLSQAEALNYIFISYHKSFKSG